MTLVAVSSAVLGWRQLGVSRSVALAETVAKLGVEVARLTGDLSAERAKRRELEDKVDSLMDNEKALQVQVRNFRHGIRRLHKQIRDELHAEPVWSPDEG
ncbi:MAG: hypothetical protein KF698_08380 [Anaerolineales bacterium]|nr:hypothetical protein [Anaerolineales bacterium]